MDPILQPEPQIAEKHLYLLTYLDLVCLISFPLKVQIQYLWVLRGPDVSQSSGPNLGCGISHISQMWPRFHSILNSPETRQVLRGPKMAQRPKGNELRAVSAGYADECRQPLSHWAKAKYGPMKTAGLGYIWARRSLLCGSHRHHSHGGEEKEIRRGKF